MLSLTRFKRDLRNTNRRSVLMLKFDPVPLRPHPAHDDELPSFASSSTSRVDQGTARLDLVHGYHQVALGHVYSFRTRIRGHENLRRRGKERKQEEERTEHGLSIFTTKPVSEALTVPKIVQKRNAFFRVSKSSLVFIIVVTKMWERNAAIETGLMVYGRSPRGAKLSDSHASSWHGRGRHLNSATIEAHASLCVHCRGLSASVPSPASHRPENKQKEAVGATELNFTPRRTIQGFTAYYKPY